MSKEECDSAAQRIREAIGAVRTTLQETRERAASAEALLAEKEALLAEKESELRGVAADRDALKIRVEAIEGAVYETITPALKTLADDLEAAVRG